MRIYKKKIEETIAEEIAELTYKFGKGYCIAVQSIFYSSENPSSNVTLFDADGDQFMFKVPGQAIPAPTSPEIPITVKLPLSYVDNEGENELIIWGEVYSLDNKSDSTF